VILKKYAKCLAVFVVSITLVSCFHPTSPEEQERPNILLIVADDLGYSDIAPFGSEIHTPNLQKLATAGTRFTDFNVAATCTPTRAMLLTGVDHHKIGFGGMLATVAKEQEGMPGYETRLLDNVITLPEMLQDAGYRTLISGKWDLGGRNGHGQLPTERGFDSSFALVDGSADHFRSMGAFTETSTPYYVKDGHPIEIQEDFFSSKDFSDQLINQLKETQNENKPFFAMLTYTAPHYPVQSPKSFAEKYMGKYDVGYQKIHADRINRMRELGIMGTQQAAAQPYPDMAPEFHTLDAEFQDIETRRMEGYAGMVESMDYHLGRVLSYLEQTGENENTIIIFMSDNGAAGEAPLSWGYYDWAEETYDQTLAAIGLRDSYTWIGPAWGWVSAAPFKGYKFLGTEGGIKSPLIVFKPGQKTTGSISRSPLYITDVVPTILEWAGIDNPNGLYKGRKVEQLIGQSFDPLLSEPEGMLHPDTYSFGWEILNSRAIRMGKWKATANKAPWGKGVKNWSLYNLETDPAEAIDLADQEPEKLAMLLEAWDAYVEQNGLVLVDNQQVDSMDKIADHFKWRPRKVQ